MALAFPERMSENAVSEFGAFYEEWFDRVYNYARHRTGSASRAEFLRLVEKAKAIDARQR